MSSNTLTAIGIALQVAGAAYLLWQSSRTTKALKSFTDVNYNNFAHLLNQLKNELQGQFKHQVAGFFLLLVGSTLQLMALT